MTVDKKKTVPSLAGYSPPLLKPRNPLRWGVFVAFNFVVFAVANAFWMYLQTGHWVDFSSGWLRRDLTTPLGQVLLEPLSIFQHPWMIAVVSLTLGLLIVIPLAVSVMYPLLLAIAFVILVAVLGHEPWLALALAAGCLLSARSRLRREYPFLAILMGLIPVGVYLYLLTYAGIDASLLMPLQRWILAVPFLLAMLLAVLMAEAVVIMARWMKFQPGVIWPAVVLLLPIALVFFYVQVGPAELDYALLVRPLAQGEDLLPGVWREEWVRRHGAGLSEQGLLNRLQDDLIARKNSLCQQCDAFLARHGDSQRAASVAWIRAQCHSLQPDMHSFQRQFILYSSSWPMAASAGAWEDLLRDYPNSPQAALARWNLGRIELRQAGSLSGEAALRQAEAGDALLRSARDQLRDLSSRRHREEPWSGESSAGIFAPMSPLPATLVYDAALMDAEVLTWRIARNDVLKDSRSARALGQLLAVNPCQGDYARNVKALAGQKEFQGAAMADNLKMAAAKLLDDEYERAEAMIALAANERTDSAIEANYELGQLAMQTAQTKVIPLVSNLKTPEKYFQIVVNSPPNPWQDRAAEKLRWLRPTPREEHK
jgi:ribosomal protein S27AE